MAVNDQNRTRKTYSFFRASPKDAASTVLSGGLGISIEGNKNLIIISAEDSIVSNSISFSSLSTDATASSGLTLVDASAGNVNVCLPDALQHQGYPFFIKKIDSSAYFANVRTIDESSQLIDGEAVQSFDTQWTSIHVTASGSNWYIL